MCGNPKKKRPNFIYIETLTHSLQYFNLDNKFTLYIHMKYVHCHLYYNCSAMYCDSKNSTIGGKQNQHRSVYTCSGLGTESSNLKFTMSCNELQYVLITSINGRSK